MNSVEARSKQLHFIASLHIPPHQIQPLVSRINIPHKITPLVEFLFEHFGILILCFILNVFSSCARQEPVQLSVILRLQTIRLGNRRSIQRIGRNLIFSTVSRNTLGRTQSPIQWALGMGGVGSVPRK
jgi:hypothetical protein